MENNIAEVWREVKNFPLYQVSNLGNVRLKETGEIVQRLYPRVGLIKRRGVRAKAVSVHKLVAEAFLDKTDENLIVNHKDGDKQNANLENLEYITRSENSIHAYETGLRKRLDDGYRKNCKPVVARDPDNKIHEFGSVRLAAKASGTDSSSVVNCCRGRITHQHGWQYLYKIHYDTGRKFPERKKKHKYNAKAVLQIDRHTGDVLAEFKSAREAAVETGVQFSKVSQVCNGKRKTSGGYAWRFKDNIN